MARMPNVVVPGVPLHVTLRGAPRQPLLCDTLDYAALLLDLGEAAAVFGCAVHAYVLMPDRVQLLMTPAEGNGPSRLTEALGRRHPRSCRGLQVRVGSGVAELARSTALHTDLDLLACSRQIELDPVRAGIVSEPVAYRWSSYRANGLGARDAVLTPHPVYLALGAGAAERQRAYRALFERRVDAEAVRLLRRRPLAPRAITSG